MNNNNILCQAIFKVSLCSSTIWLYCFAQKIVGDLLSRLSKTEIACKQPKLKIVRNNIVAAWQLLLAIPRLNSSLTTQWAKMLSVLTSGLHVLDSQIVFHLAFPQKPQLLPLKLFGRVQNQYTDEAFPNLQRVSELSHISIMKTQSSKTRL